MHKSDWLSNQYGERLKSARARARMSQHDLAHELATTQPTISRIETGRIPSKTMAKDIIAFIQNQEMAARDDVGQIVRDISGSEELRRLVARIIAGI